MKYPLVDRLVRQIIAVVCLVFVCELFVYSAFGATCEEFWNDNSLPIDENVGCLTWAVPTQNADGSPINDLAGYRIYSGKNKAAIETVKGEDRRADSSITWVEINNAQADAHEMLINVTEPTTIYFGITAIDSSGNESLISQIVDKVIRFVDTVPPGQVQTFRVQLRIRVPVPGGELQHPKPVE